jgi:phosphatidylglycerol:prolipoprotein diacylglycerol transferase
MARTSKPATRSRPPRQTAVRQYRRQTATAQPTPRVAAAQPGDPTPPSTGVAALMERGSRQILAVTYWFNPVPRPEPYPVTIRFSGRRVGVEGQPQDGDQFIQEATIKEVVPGSGPIALTARVHGVNPGEWEVKASVLEPARPRRGRQEPETTRPLDGSLNPLARLWLKWAPPVDPAIPVKTRLVAFIRVPGMIPSIWGLIVGLGIVVALVVQSLVLAHEHVAVGPVLAATSVAIVVGILGAKVWYIVKHRRERDIIGWCIQGFITGATLAAVIAFAIVRAPLGTVLDAAAPGLMLGLAVGRVGCFLAGCCGGPPTASRWGVWCSDQHVGARRVPTQLMESLFSLILGLVTLVAILTRGPAGGAYFVAVLAAYTLFREGILRLRAEPLTTRLPVPITAVVSTLVLVAVVVAIAR